MTTTPGFDLRLVFAKTAEGAAELVSRQHGLSTVERRILILVDGHRRLADLPPFARPGEIGPIVNTLQSHGLIRLAGIADDPPAQARPDDPEDTRARLQWLRQQLAGSFERELGSDGRVLEARLRDSISLEVARRVVRDGIEAVSQRCGRAAADRVAQLSRRAFAEPETD